MRQQSKQQQCEQAECEVRGAFLRLRKANQKNKVVAVALKKQSSIAHGEDDAPPLDMEDSGLHEIS